jgi:hypothetical protein
MVRSRSMAVLCGLLLCGAVFAASAPIKPAAKDLLNRAAGALIDTYDIKAKTVGTGDEKTDTFVCAVYLMVLGEHRKDYREATGPYISEPVAFLASKVKDDGTVDGAKADAGLAAYVTAAALTATGNDAYKPQIEKLNAKAKAPAPMEITKLEQIASIDMKQDSLFSLVAALKKLVADKKKEVTIDGKPVEWAPVLAECILKHDKGGKFGGDLKTDALVLQALGLAYKQLE